MIRGRRGSREKEQPQGLGIMRLPALDTSIHARGGRLGMASATGSRSATDLRTTLSQPRRGPSPSPSLGSSARTFAATTGARRGRPSPIFGMDEPLESNGGEPAAVQDFFNGPPPLSKQMQKIHKAGREAHGPPPIARPLDAEEVFGRPSLDQLPARHQRAASESAFQKAMQLCPLTKRRGDSRSPGRSPGGGSAVLAGPPLAASRNGSGSSVEAGSEASMELSPASRSMATRLKNLGGVKRPNHGRSFSDQPPSVAWPSIPPLPESTASLGHGRTASEDHLALNRKAAIRRDTRKPYVQPPPSLGYEDLIAPASRHFSHRTLKPQPGEDPFEHIPPSPIMSHRGGSSPAASSTSSVETSLFTTSSGDNAAWAFRYPFANGQQKPSMSLYNFHMGSSEEELERRPSVSAPATRAAYGYLEQPDSPVDPTPPTGSRGRFVTPLLTPPTTDDEASATLARSYRERTPCARRMRSGTDTLRESRDSTTSVYPPTPATSRTSKGRMPCIALLPEDVPDVPVSVSSDARDSILDPFGELDNTDDDWGRMFTANCPPQRVRSARYVGEMPFHLVQDAPLPVPPVPKTFHSARDSVSTSTTTTDVPHFNWPVPPTRPHAQPAREAPVFQHDDSDLGPSYDPVPIPDELLLAMTVNQRMNSGHFGSYKQMSAAVQAAMYRTRPTSMKLGAADHLKKKARAAPRATSDSIKQAGYNRSRAPTQ